MLNSVLIFHKFLVAPLPNTIEFFYVILTALDENHSFSDTQGFKQKLIILQKCLLQKNILFGETDECMG